METDKIIEQITKVVQDKKSLAPLMGALIGLAISGNKQATDGGQIEAFREHGHAGD